MEKVKGNTNSMMSVVSVPVALTGLLLLFFFATFFADDLMIDTEKLVVLPLAAAFAAVLGRIGILKNSNLTTLFSLGFILVAIILDLLSIVDPLVSLTFVITGVSTVYLANSKRNEEATIVFSIIAGFHLAVSYASGMPELTLAEGSSVQGQIIDIERASIAANFFSFWIASITLGIIMAIFMRGVIDQPGKGNLFSFLPPSKDLKVDNLIVASIILIVNLIPLVWISSITDASQFESHLYLGNVWSIVTTVVVMFVTFCRSERWHVIGSLVAVNWVIYTLAHLVEIGNTLPTSIDFLSSDDTISTLTWFGIWFWTNILTAMFASRGYFGDISPRREPSSFRKWWQTNYYSILLGSAVIIGFLVRTGWNVLPAMNANITGIWDMSGGSDPWYMKRVVDYIIMERSHFIFDADRAYPVGGINPRPPLFSWYLALGGLALEWITGMPSEDVVWWSVAGLPAIFGALIVLPVSGIARRVHSSQAGIIAAWLMALMPGHIDKATFGLADHDSFALLFLTLAFYYWVKSVEGTNSERMFRNPSANPLYLVAGVRQMWHSNPIVMANATLAGICFSTVALGWKGFVYGPGILFLAFAAQIVMNLFRRRDSLQLTSAAIQMMITTLVMPLPFYIWPGMNLLLAPSGFQPMFYIVGFTIALGWVSCSFRDKPWLLVLGSGVVLFGGILGILWILQQAELYDGWDILFTGGFYFSKNKIFGTIGEAQAPSRGVLFASYGPIVTLIAIGYAFILLWRGGRNDRPSQSLLGLWVIIATYMAWTAGRFIFNATPAMAVVGAIGIAALWKAADFSNFTKVWRRSGIGTPKARFASARSASRKHPMIPALVLVFMLVASQHVTYGIDSGIPRGEPSAGDVDQTIYDMTPDILRFEILGLSILDDSAHNPTDTCASGCWYMGTFGSGFNGGGWNMAYEWLSEQDTDKNFTNRPAFVSWWDYGFQALESGDHPTVADNFQSGIPNSGAMLLSSGQEQTIAMFITSLIQGDKQYEEGSDFTPEFVEVINRHLTTQQQVDELTSIMNFGVGDVDFVQARALTLIDQDEEVELLHGSKLDSNGLPGQSLWYVHEEGVQSGNSTMDESEARALYNSIRDRTEEARNNNNDNSNDEITHYIIGEYHYTSDLVEDFDDVSTNLHRANARLALARAFLTSVFTLPELVDLYDDLSTSLEYEVQTYDGKLGEKVTRNNEIRYFAIDDRLYPLGGMYYEDSSYHRGQTTGIFYAPTTLSGLDPDNYIESVYITQRGDAPQRGMTGQEYEAAYLNDIVAQQSGALQDSSQIIRLVDIEYRQTEEFFETMVARIYVGYGTSTLGLSGNPSTPSPTWALSGTPGSALEYTYALPGAMMNHFVIANWYNDGTDSPDNDNNSIPDVFDGGYASIGRANSNVKIVKYYSGATLEGTVTLDEVGPIPNARILIERDAFSGDETADEEGNVVDMDQRTYWVPIGTTDADENGDYSFVVPAGRIRVSAFFGEPNLDDARMQFASNARAIGNQMLQDIATESTDDLGERQVNLVTGILANVSGSQWLAETIVNVSGSDGHSNGESIINADISATPSFATGRLSWTGEGEFDGQAITNAIVELTPSWDEISLEPITLETSTGTVTGSNLIFQGIGEVTFTGDGEVTSTGIATVSDFIGTHTQTIQHGHSLTGDGEFSGRGTFSGTISDHDPSQIADCNENQTMPEDNEICLLPDEQYLVDGVINATGRFTSNGTSSFSQIHNGSTISGSGYFKIDSSDESLDSYGTINGTGTFTGEGTFSGPMVREGTFHVNDAVPGLYDITVIFEDETRVDLDDQFIIGFSGLSQIQEVDVAGGVIVGDLIDTAGQPILGSLLMLDKDSDSEDSNGECSEIMYAPCHITAAENGSLYFGPITPGEYTFVLDQDSDGFNEAELSQTYTSEEGTITNFPSPIGNFYDLTFTLDRFENTSNVAVTEIDVLFTSADGTNGEVTSVYDSDLLEYHVELAEGNWILSHTLSESEQLWEEIAMFDDHIDSFTFRTSTSVTGVAYYETGSPDVIDGVESIENAQTIENVPVNFYWDGFSTTAITDGDGVFNVVLPVGAVVDATVNAGVYNVVNGTRFTVQEGMDNITMIARPGNIVEGSININRLGNFYSSSLEGWEDATIFASHESIEAVWVIDVDRNGQFSVVLPNGNWTFDTDIDWLNISSSTLYVDGNNDTMNIYSYPVDSTVDIEFFLDNSGDNNFSNGTPVIYDFSIVSLNSFGETINVSSNSNYWVDAGQVSIPVEAGSYKINVEISDARSGDLFGTRIMTGDTYFDVGYGGDLVTRSIGFDPEWRVDLTFNNYSGGLLSDENVKFINTDNGWILSRMTDSNGTLIDHLPEGEWIASIAAVDTGDGVVEGLRELITVSPENADVKMTLNTIELASFNVQLQGPDNQSLEGVDIVLTSNDGLGKIHLDLTDSFGNSEGLIFPGSWNIEVNHTDDRRRYVIESTELSNGPLSSGPAGDFVLFTENLVELSGNVFWDLNDDDDSDVGEGVSEVAIHMTSDDYGEYHLVTDGAGDWSIYVPLDSYWDVTATTLGFSEENRTISVSSPNSVDIELTAGSVGVSGNVTHNDIVSIGDSVELTLIPIQGMIRDRVTPTKILVDGTWNGAWNASVEPGRWILRAEHQESNLIAMSVIDADISEGGSSDVELELGGWLYLSTMWLNYDGDVGDLGDSNLMDLEFIVQLGAGIQWDAVLDNEGATSILLPSGTVEVSSSFSVEQMNRIMEYNAGNNINIPASATNLLASTNQEISFTRTANHNIESEITSMIGGNSSNDDFSDVEILFADDGNYTTVEYTITVDYLGHEPISAYSVVGNVAGTDGSDWNVTFFDDSENSDNNSSGIWLNEYSFDMGLDGDNTSFDLHVRVDAANRSTAQSLEEGHTVSIQFMSSSGLSHTQQLLLRVPQYHEFELLELSEVFGIRPGEELSIPMEIRNAGNGDERFEFEFDDSQLPEGWERTGATSHTLGAFVTTTHTIKVIAPEDVSGDEDFTITVYTTDKSGGTYPAIPIQVKMSSPVLEVKEVFSNSEPVFGTIHKFIVTVENTGLVDSNNVDLNASIRGTDVFGVTTMDVPAGQEVNFFIDVDLSSFSAEQVWVDFTIEGDDVGEDPDVESKRYTLRSPGVDDSDATNYLMWALIAMLIFAIYYFTRGGIRRPGAPF
tara:strand:- start:45677 stop:55171 length:9495 start_codon:yes stop_codon:yes gene_type:complete